MPCASYCGLEAWLKNSEAIQQNNRTMLFQPLHRLSHILHNDQNRLLVGPAAYQSCLLPLILLEVAHLVILACNRKTDKTSPMEAEHLRVFTRLDTSKIA